MKILINEVKNSWESIGRDKLNLSNAEKIYKKYRRSIYVSKNIKKGEIFNKHNLKVIRPGLGLAPEYFEKILGKVSKKDLKKGDALKMNYVNFN